MGPKRKLSREEEKELKTTSDDDGKKKKRKTGEPKAVQAERKKPTTLKDKILHLLSNQEKLVGLATIKKILYDEYEVDNSTARNKRITKSL
jgi:hypothetical protein